MQLDAKKSSKGKKGGRGRRGGSRKLKKKEVSKPALKKWLKKYCAEVKPSDESFSCVGVATKMKGMMNYKAGGSCGFDLWLKSRGADEWTKSCPWNRWRICEPGEKKCRGKGMMMVNWAACYARPKNESVLSASWAPVPRFRRLTSQFSVGPRSPEARGSARAFAGRASRTGREAAKPPVEAQAKEPTEVKEPPKEEPKAAKPAFPSFKQILQVSEPEVIDLLKTYRSKNQFEYIGGFLMKDAAGQDPPRAFGSSEPSGLRRDAGKAESVNQLEEVGTLLQVLEIISFSNNAGGQITVMPKYRVRKTGTLTQQGLVTMLSPSIYSLSVLCFLGASSGLSQQLAGTLHWRPFASSEPFQRSIRAATPLRAKKKAVDPERAAKRKAAMEARQVALKKAEAEKRNLEAAKRLEAAKARQEAIRRAAEERQKLQVNGHKPAAVVTKRDSKRTREAAPADLDFGSMTVVELKEELRKRGLKVSGKKQELIERLQAQNGAVQDSGAPTPAVRAIPRSRVAIGPFGGEQGAAADYTKMKVAELREELKKLQQPTTGRKDELIQRLQAATSAERAQPQPQRPAVGQKLRGTVTGLRNFGAFVDIGLGRPALVRTSRLAERHVRAASEVVQEGEESWTCTSCEGISICVYFLRIV
eukprot:g20845.t1